MNLLRRIANDLQNGKNYDLYVLISASLIITVLGLLEITSIEIISILTIDALGVIAVSLLVNRSKVDELYTKMDYVESDIFFYTRLEVDAIEPRIRNAKRLDMLGASLLNLSIAGHAGLEQIQSAGGKVRLILTNPENIFLQELLATRYLEAKTADEHANQIRTALASFKHLVGVNDQGGSINVRITDMIPSFSYFGTDSDHPGGEISIELYLNDIPLSRNPIFTLYSQKDQKWFTEFARQFDYNWENATDAFPR